MKQESLPTSNVKFCNFIFSLTNEYLVFPVQANTVIVNTERERDDTVKSCITNLFEKIAPLNFPSFGIHSIRTK